MFNCFEGRVRGELLSLALQCCHLIDVAIEADRAKRSEWWDETCRFSIDCYSQIYVAKDFVGNVTTQTAIRKLKALSPHDAIALLHELEKAALWRSDRGPIPPPEGLRELFKHGPSSH